ncbi:hypothetical protein QOZ80_3BG0270750 [Eleusine coracana subsp. coracana]|nr:hypothetical protein QOZ80_3BG0270750 [Eleusine coracana subsp. coracana]
MASDDELYDYDYDDEELEDVDSEGVEMEEDDCDGGHLEDEDDVSVPEPPVKCLAITKEALSNAQQEDLTAVMNLFNIKQHHARADLIRYRWNMERITDQMERKGQDIMLMEAGVASPHQEGNDGAARSRRVTCGVCFEDFSSPRKVSTMDCGHSFCNDCWTGYFVSSLDSGKKQIRCMALKCPAICDEAVVQRLLRGEHPAAAARFLDFLLNSYVDDNAAVMWCPSVPHCGHAIRASSGESAPLCEVECPCGHGFCFRCAAPAHSPCPCAMWERWEAKCLGEAENVKWLLANTKTCPKCFKSSSRRAAATTSPAHAASIYGTISLLWLCGAATGLAHDYERIEGHSCNRFDEDKKRKVDDAQRQLRRYEHYYKRFQAHDMSYRSERDKLGPSLVENVIDRLESHDSVLYQNAAQSLADSHRTLLVCRQVLSRSFVFAYYMFDDEDVTTTTQEGTLLAQAKELFENYQQGVEALVEKLTELLDTTSKLPEEDKEEELLKEFEGAKKKALNYAATIEAHCGKMYACIQDELLPMLVEPMVIAPFQKKGPLKAHKE